MSLNSKEAIINLNQIRFAYSKESERCVLDLPSWNVAAEESVLLIGESGSGKSTLLNMLCGILIPDSGTMNVAGQALETMNNRQRDRFRAKQIGYVAQNFNLIPYLSAIDNIKLANYFSRNASDASNNNPNNGLEMKALLLELNITQEHWNRPISQLSIGQQQRIAIARAVVNRPQLLIADEPTSSLDQSNRDNFMSILMATAKAHETTLVFVSHDLSLSRYFDRIDSMSDINKSA